MKKISVREHFRRIAKANEEYLEEHLANLTVEKACRDAAGLLALSRYFDLTPRDYGEFVPLSELIRRHKARRGNRASRGAGRRRRGP